MWTKFIQIYSYVRCESVKISYANLDANTVYLVEPLSARITIVIKRYSEKKRIIEKREQKNVKQKNRNRNEPEHTKVK